MSKNNRMRRAAESLPSFPKFRKDGKVMHDVNGGMVMEDHFKVIKNLISAAGDDKYRAEKDVTNYMKKVRSYDIYTKRLEMDADRIKRRKMRIKNRGKWSLIVVVWGLALSVLYVITLIILKYAVNV